MVFTHTGLAPSKRQMVYTHIGLASTLRKKKSLITRCLAILNTHLDVLYAQITTGVYGTPVFRGMVIVDKGYLQGCLATWWLVAFCAVRTKREMVSTHTDLASTKRQIVSTHKGFQSTN